MKILYLSHRIPYPPNKGDKIRSFNEIKFLSQDHEIHLACTADDPADVKYEMELGRYCKKTAVEPIQKSICKAKTALHIFSGAPLSVGYFYSRKLQKTIDHWLSMHAYDAVLCFSSPMAEYLFRSPLIPPSHIPKQNSKFEIRNSKLVMDFCDVDSDKWLQYARQSPFPLNMIYGLEHRRLSAYETKITRCFDHSVFVSRQEADLFLQKHPQAKNVSVITNGVDDEYFAARPPGRPAAHLKPATRNPQPATRNPQPATRNPFFCSPAPWIIMPTRRESPGSAKKYTR